MVSFADIQFLCYMCSASGLLLYLAAAVTTAIESLPYRILLSGSIEVVLVVVRWYNEVKYDKYGVGDVLHHIFVIVGGAIQYLAFVLHHSLILRHGWLLVHLNVLHVPCGLWYLGCRGNSSFALAAVAAPWRRTIVSLAQPVVAALRMCGVYGVASSAATTATAAASACAVCGLPMQPSMRGRGPSVALSHKDGQQLCPRCVHHGSLTVTPPDASSEDASADDGGARILLSADIFRVLDCCQTLFTPAWYISTYYRCSVLLFSLLLELQAVQGGGHAGILAFGTCLFALLTYLDCGWELSFLSALGLLRSSGSGSGCAASNKGKGKGKSRSRVRGEKNETSTAVEAEAEAEAETEAEAEVGAAPAVGSTAMFSSCVALAIVLGWMATVYPASAVLHRTSSLSSSNNADDGNSSLFLVGSAGVVTIAMWRR